ncbi:unnamed protein product, partial [Rotaria magnacalcarata]
KTWSQCSSYWQILSKNFKLLYPHQFQIDNFLSLTLYQLRHMQHPDYYSSTQEQFGNNHDYFQLQQKFVDTYISQRF